MITGRGFMPLNALCDLSWVCAGIKLWAAWDRDLAPEGDTLDDSQRNLEESVDLCVELQQRTGIRPLWLAADLHSHPRQVTSYLLFILQGNGGSCLTLPPCSQVLPGGGDGAGRGRGGAGGHPAATRAAGRPAAVGRVLLVLGRPRRILHVAQHGPRPRATGLRPPAQDDGRYIPPAPETFSDIE